MHIFVGNITKEIKIVKSQSFLYWRAYFIGSQNQFTWFDLMVRFKSYVNFGEGFEDSLGQFHKFCLIIAFCLYTVTQDYHAPR